MSIQLVHRTLALAAVFSLFVPAPAVARSEMSKDVVLEWNAVLRVAVVSPLNSPQIPEPARFRIGAIVHTAMFDALNGIERRHRPIRVASQAPRDSSTRAAVVQAAYSTLVALVPASTAIYDAQLEASLDAIATGPEADSPESIERGRTWGHKVAEEVLFWRASDGFNAPAPPYLGSDVPGKWRPTPAAFAPGLLPSLARTAPFVVPNVERYRPEAPPEITSEIYATEFAEVKSIGEQTSTVRTADQSEAARFWAGTAMTFWNRAAEQAAIQRRTSLAENARLFALLNTAMADGVISSWSAKYVYEYWRPVTAIRLAGTDGNPATVEQSDWTPLVSTPPYPEYPAGHPTVSGAAQAVLTSFFGSQMPVEGTSESLPGVVRSWPNFDAAADEANLARIWAGIHFRSAVVKGRAAGDAVGRYVVKHAAKPLRGGDKPGA